MKSVSSLRSSDWKRSGTRRRRDSWDIVLSSVYWAQMRSAWKYREWYDSVLKVSWRVSDCDAVHQDAQLVRNTLMDRRPVECLQCSCDVVRSRKSRMNRATAYSTRCNGASVESGRPANAVTVVYASLYWSADKSLSGIDVKYAAKPAKPTNVKEACWVTFVTKQRETNTDWMQNEAITNNG